MRVLIIVVCIILYVAVLHTQAQENPFVIVEKMPSFGQCGAIEDAEERKKCTSQKLARYIIKEVRYPKAAKQHGVKGSAVIRFVIEKDGSVTTNESSILKDPGHGTGAEALRVVQSMPKWNPGEQEGKPVAVQYVIPIKFSMEGTASTTNCTWGNTKINAHYSKYDESEMVKAEISLADLQNLLKSHNKRGMPILFDTHDETKKHELYYVSVGKTGRKYTFEYTGKNKRSRKKVAKEAKVGKVIYFYNAKFKRKFLEITVQ